MPGKKTLIVDPKVTPLLNLTIDVPSLNNAGINQILEVQNVEFKKTFDKETTQILIMIPPKMDITKRVAQIIRQHEGIGPQRQYLLVFWPQRTILCKELLDQEGVMSSVELRDFTFDLIPLDLDVLSLEMPDSFRDMIVDYDLSIYNYVAESINRLQLVMGNIPNIYCKGEGAKMVYDILKLESGEINPESTEIESLMIFDRSLDLFTPMLTQLVYEGLVDEFFNIDGNLLKVEKKILGKEGAGSDEKTIIQFSSERDPLIYQVRNLLLAPLGGYLQEQTQQQERDKEEFQREKSKNLNDKLVQHAKRIKAEQESVSKHINISTKITQYFRTVEFYKRLNLEQGIINGEKQEKTLDYIEALIQVGADLNKVMRLLCLRSIYDGGLKQKTYDYFRKEIIQVYGFKTIQFINNLQRAGMFVRNDGNKSVWPKLQEQLKLLDVDIKSTDPNPKDCAYTYSGHCPLIARLVELIFKKPFSWKGNKSMQLIPGFQYEPEKPVKNVPQQDGRKPIVIIYILGGVTFGEISAFRLLGKLFQKEIIICTTNVMNGTKFIDSLRERI
ncbi:hypothetical protein pb186bvf_010674 [Paramecium bursaria]